MQRAILLACLGFAAPAAAQDTARVVVAATADLQGQVTGWDDAFERAYPGGLVRAATVLDSLRRRHPDQLVVADAGNALFGSPLASYLAANPRDPDPIVEAQNLAGVDVATLARRDLDRGVPFVRRALRTARFPHVADAPPPLDGESLALPRHVVLRRGPLRVAVTAAATAPLDPRAVRALRAEADLVVVLLRGEAMAPSALAGDDAPDLVVLGGPAVTDPGAARPHVARPAPQGRTVSVTHLVARREAGRWRLAEAHTEAVVTADVRENPRVMQRLTPVHEELTASLAQVVASADGALPGRFARVEAVPVMGFVLDAMRARTGAPLALAPAVRASAGLPDGDVRRADVVGLYPFDHTLMAIRLTGAQLREHLERTAQWYVVGPAGQVAPDPAAAPSSFDVLGGASYQLDLAAPAGRRVRGLAIAGREPGASDSFTVALPADRAARFPGAPIVHDRGERLRDVLVEEAARRRTLAPAPFAERHWRLVPDSLAARARQRIEEPARAAAPRPRRDSVALRILTLNDFHAALEPTTEPDGSVLGGIAVLDAVMDSAARQCRCPTLRLDAGDALQGSLGSTLDHGRTALQALGLLGVAAGAVGNHELDWGADTLRARLRESPYPWLAANLVDSATGARVPWVRSHVVVTAGGLRVGLVGYVTRHLKRVV
ncbi:MAG: 5'-nucleotidase C-terminal domain-containing protein, partial [Gemmatimonadales bacterium]|nr:5'-nucleotidase C-terminal domain-containing protein [Gemmatimonadales bacterium]